MAIDFRMVGKSADPLQARLQGTPVLKAYAEE